MLLLICTAVDLMFLHAMPPLEPPYSLDATVATVQVQATWCEMRGQIVAPPAALT
jgi:hypothetical protein